MNKIIIYSVLLITFLGRAQNDKKVKDDALPKANKEYQEKKYVDAEALYRVSSSKKVSGLKSSYNLGNSIYKQNKPEEAKYAYAKVLKESKAKPEKHNTYHNLGNIFIKEKAYSKAVEAYKNALRNNPYDEQTRYNYALAKKLQKENPEKPEDKKDDKKKDKDKDKKKEQDKKQEPKDDKGDKDPKENQNNQPNPSPGGMSKQQLENLLEAVNKEEKKVQERMNRPKVKGKPSKTEKDW